MIYCDKGEVKIKGTKSDIKAELSCLLRSLIVHDSVLTKDDLDDCIEFVNLTDEEVESRTNKVLSMIFSEILLRSLKEAVKNNDGENNDGEED